MTATYSQMVQEKIYVYFTLYIVCVYVCKERDRRMLTFEKFNSMLCAKIL